VAIFIHTVQLKAFLGQIYCHYLDVSVFDMLVHGSPRLCVDWIEISILAHYDAD
jgi:hypothetical protein